MIIPHYCTNPEGDRAAQFQDQKYGSGKRVANKVTSRDHEYRCTVCGQTVIYRR